MQHSCRTCLFGNLSDQQEPCWSCHRYYPPPDGIPIRAEPDTACKSERLRKRLTGSASLRRHWYPAYTPHPDEVGWPDE